MRPKALILFATGTNRDQDVAQAIELSGATAEIMPLSYLKKHTTTWNDYQILIVAGGFSYADALGAGKLLALELEHIFSDEVHEFVARGKPTLGICNGFQALVKAGILPYTRTNDKTLPATLTFNQHGHFECRWVTLKPASRVCIWTRGLTELVDCPVAHGEGNFVVQNEEILNQLIEKDQIAFTYTNAKGDPANGTYPENPNGSVADIAGICNPEGNVLGLMPHPENNIYPYQHPLWRYESQHPGLPIFLNGIQYANEM